MVIENQIVIYHDKDSGVTIDVKLDGETEVRTILF